MSTTGTATSGTEYKYWAFISYSHGDDSWARWLHRNLEGYRVSRKLAGLPSRDGTVPRRLYPIFRDRDELPVSSDLGANIKNSLQQSRYLIVICSPRAARSLWVNEEVRLFKAGGREDRVLCLIVEGEPNATDHGDPEAECFPSAIRYRLGDGDALSTIRTEPIAADARRNMDGRTNARLKLIAGLLGVDFDQLKRRERVRRNQRWAMACAVALLGGLAVFFGAQWQARRHRIERYVAQGGEELKAGNSLRAMAYLTEAYALGGRNDLLVTRLREGARALVPQVALLEGHGQWVTAVAFDPAGERLLSAGWDGTARIVQPNRAGSLPVILQGHEGKLSSAAFSLDGQRVVTGGWDGTARVWDLAGRLLTTCAGHGKRVNSVAFSPDGAQILTAGDDQTARLWAADGTPLRTFEGHRSTVKWAAFSPDGTCFATASFDRSLRLWETATGRQLWAKEFAHEDGINCVAFTPDGLELITAGLDGKVKVWAHNGPPPAEPLAVLEDYRGRLNQCALSRDGRYLVTACDDGCAKIWETASWRTLYSIEPDRAGAGSEATRGKIFCATFGPGLQLVTGGEDGTIRVWNPQTVTPLAPEQIVAAARQLSRWRLVQEAPARGEPTAR